MPIQILALVPTSVVLWDQFRDSRQGEIAVRPGGGWVSSSFNLWDVPGSADFWKTYLVVQQLGNFFARVALSQESFSS